MSFLIRNLRSKTASHPAIPDVVSTVLLDVRAYGFSSAVSALLRDLRN
ncbi:MAG TPA: hypothetical protein VLC92_17280 [Rhodocyclaceae bacterium]|nr:hypothetical protein [Rhodocyclaceae bacterium]